MPWTALPIASPLRAASGWFLAARTAIASAIGCGALLAMCATFEIGLPLAWLCGLAAFLSVVRGQGILSHLLGARVFQYLGTISYSFYLWHIALLSPLKRIFGWHGGLIPNGPLNLLVFAAVGLACSLMAADLSYRAIEQWATHRYLRRRSSPTRGVADAPCPSRAEEPPVAVAQRAA
jgi:peptidoglycan/LPS O-acetylase OafA/YrhL